MSNVCTSFLQRGRVAKAKLVLLRRIVRAASVGKNLQSFKIEPGAISSLLLNLFDIAGWIVARLHGAVADDDFEAPLAVSTGQ